ncbi:Aste57867_15211 [Aphanomyces stellatus]|uniref:Aste57867_15211 protein n=1 Tax=Aphanomyces stellatus TaxID=120398 RepID=A0A485L2L8_9STRA|nr:hypothetical protein As57867_015155 [Aphanomyces stellatus]VFT92020.1 Aste57867_15211 [Aphanomyces stellatus]
MGNKLGHYCCVSSRAPRPVSPSESPAPGATPSLVQDSASTVPQTTPSAPQITLGDVLALYDVEKKDSNHGAVRVGTHKETGAKVSIKFIPKANRADALREVDILRRLDHPNIVKLMDVYEDTRYLYLVTELCMGGELFDRILARGHYTEADGVLLVRTMLNVVKHCHDRGVCHRDLKPEAMLFVTTDDDAALKVTAFGLASTDAVMTTRNGTPYYIAPEVLGGRYDKSCDLWSVGVITYILLCGAPPFSGETDADVLAAVRKGTFSYDAPEWVGVSVNAKDFIHRLLTSDKSKRLTAVEALHHPWLSGSPPASATHAIE